MLRALLGAFLVVALSSQAPATTPAVQQPPSLASCPEMATALTGLMRNDARLRDWAQLARYRNANESLPGASDKRVVFMGDSITDAWPVRFASSFFPGKPYVGRGISGQTTPQMLVRFRQDVVALKPKVVVILAGINDIAGNTGPATQAMIADNLMSMTEIAQANGIRVVLSSVLPAYDFPWKRGIAPAPKVVALNSWIRCYAGQAGAVYLDYYSKMVDARGGLSPEMASDGVHPTDAGYRIMAPLAEAAIQEALRRP
jgi:acyl-CoA thioesterase I